MISALHAVSTIYVLFDLQRLTECRLQNQSPSVFRMKDQLESYLREVQAALAIEVSNMARVFRDYIAVVCAGEARHAKTMCEYHWKGFLDSGSSRNAVFPVAHWFDPTDILTAAAQLFSFRWNTGSYGGMSWARIAQAGLMYGQVPDLVFLDHVVDMSHNGGLFIDKGTILRLSYFDTYKHMLDRKTMCGLLAPDGNSPSVYLEFVDLITRGVSLGIHHTWVTGVSNRPNYEEEFINWGMKPFKLELIPKAIQEDVDRLFFVYNADTDDSEDCDNDSDDSDDEDSDDEDSDVGEEENESNWVQGDNEADGMDKTHYSEKPVRSQDDVSAASEVLVYPQG